LLPDDGATTTWGTEEAGETVQQASACGERSTAALGDAATSDRGGVVLRGDGDGRNKVAEGKSS
jgi:hypothetical protein